MNNELALYILPINWQPSSVNCIIKIPTVVAPSMTSAPSPLVTKYDYFVPPSTNNKLISDNYMKQAKKANKLLPPCQCHADISQHMSVERFCHKKEKKMRTKHG